MFHGLNGKKLRRRKRRELKVTWVGNGVFKEYVWEELGQVLNMTKMQSIRVSKNLLKNY